MSRELAVVTGASNGIGLEFARLLAASGYDLVLVARSADKLGLIAAELRGAYAVDARFICADLGVAGSAGSIVAQVPECDVLINNAGFANNGRFDMLPSDAIAQEVLLDVVTLTELTRAYLPGMRARRRGRMLNVASTAAFLPGPFMAVYYASKAYVLSFSEAIAEELRGSGVTMTVLCPGATATGFIDRARMHATMLNRLPLADARSVATAGFRGMLRGKTIVVPGISNKLVAVSPKFTPRRLLLWLSRKAVEQRHPA
ncbi:MAG: SDR family oxidoreductase [Candidatus Eremiobacteraeota bacterium]|nr:SDR family oxidoreductase [Candidatus Eremiobacteraeota bacterium]